MLVHKSKKVNLQGSVVAIGAFDGVHKGHQKVIQYTVEQGDLLNVPSVIYTFDQSPRTYFQGAQMLSNQKQKMSKLQNLGVDHTIVATFNAEYLSRSAHSFIEELEQLNPSLIIVGDDFRFGYKRMGDINLLKHHFKVKTINQVSCSKGERISSTRIRELILEGQMEQAIPLLN